MLRPGEVPGFLAALPAGVRVGLHVRGTFARGRRRRARASASRRSPPPEGEPEREDDAAYVDLTELTPEDDRGARGLARRRGRRARRCTTTRGRSTRWPRATWSCAGVTSDTALAAYLALPGQGMLRPRRPVAALPAPRAAGRAAQRRPADDGRRAVQRGRRGAGRARRRRRAARPGRRRPRGRPRPRPRAARRHRPAARPRAAARAGAGRLRADRHRRRRRAPHGARGPAARPGAQAAEAAYATVGHEFHLGSPKQLQALLFDELGLPKTKKIKTGYTTDADALQNLLGTHPVIEALLLHREIDPAAHGRGEAAAADRRRRRPHPHHLQADGRGHRPAVERRPEPAERPDPHRAGPRDPPGLRRRAAASRR